MGGFQFGHHRGSLQGHLSRFGFAPLGTRNFVGKLTLLSSGQSSQIAKGNLLPFDDNLNTVLVACFVLQNLLYIHHSPPGLGGAVALGESVGGIAAPMPIGFRTAEFTFCACEISLITRSNTGTNFDS